MTESGESSAPQQGADVGRALGIMIDALVVAPLETGLSAVRDPAGAFDRARQELRNARFIGSMVTNGGMEAFTATTGLRPPTRPSPRPAPTSDPSGETDEPTATRADEAAATPPMRRRSSDPPAPPTGSPADESADETSGADALAVPDYDQLPAIDIVDQLGELTADERDAIEAYELAHRRRRTVLGKIDQLRSA